MATSRIATPPRVKHSPKSAKSQDDVQSDEALMAQAREVADAIHQLKRGRIPRDLPKLPLFSGVTASPEPPPGQARSVQPALSKIEGSVAKGPRRQNQKAVPSLPSLERHRRKCIICRHPDREEIEEQFIHWRSPGYIANDFNFEDERYLRRHAHAVGLYARRRENYLFTLENLLERGDEIELTAAAYIKAVRAYACMCDTVRWNEPAIRVLHEHDVRTDASSQPAGLTLSEVEGPLPQGDAGNPAQFAAFVGATLGSPAPARQAAVPHGAPCAPLHHSQTPKDADASLHSSLATRHSPLPSNRPAPRLETSVTDTKQRKEVRSNRPQNAK